MSVFADTPRPALRPVNRAPRLGRELVPHPHPFVCAVTIEPRHLSRTIPHVSNIEYVRFLDRAAELHSDSVGFTREALLGEGKMWFVARHEIDYLAEAWDVDRLFIYTWARSFRRVKSWRDYILYRPADETVICRASTLWVLMDLPRRRPQRISPEMIDAFDPLERGGGESAAGSE